MSVIDKFIERYTKEYDFFQEAARICAQQCETGLQRIGIRAIVTHRAKRPDRLYYKLKKRNDEKKYRRVEDIYTDIIDLAGIRIAIYFPGDCEEVNKFIEENFEVKKKKLFPEQSKQSNQPYNKRFSGYWAKHYRICLKDDTLNESNKRYREAVIEIQVASVLMHAWAEVEHDLIYKPLSGNLSDEEYAILDELNGLVLSGEIALERLQKAVKARVGEQGERFNNHFELAAYLYDSMKQLFKKNMEPTMGRADVLYRFLQIINMDRPECIEQYLENLDPDTEKRPVTEQIVDRILAGDSNLYNKYNQARHEVGLLNPYSVKTDNTYSMSRNHTALGYFLTRWVIFESTIRHIVKEIRPDFKGSRLMFSQRDLVELKIFDDTTIFEIDSIRRLRNYAVHGIEIPESSVLYRAGEYLETCLRNLALNSDPNIKLIIEEALNKLNS
ncbi:RelA/SpoT domain-containing protein [Herbivorax sp. ANBcel31]|uniref:RelA/SpoT domain-containing protein n=1 Tax=Herbivorax sp. ANBcel31 TaxID=3069754 RepID=UPI0027B63E55|nr:RelA/SpoT domain-containing protein [Herbivorax sp. ANBcel31]MDQ2087024.1 RelA/SpoT domain-containing protein [Herbivorax sp. ANBcel31]